MQVEVSSSERVQRAIFLRTLFGSGEVAGVLARIGAMMSNVNFRPGTEIYRRGEASQFLYFIVEGRVVLEAPDESPWSFGPGDGFGFLDAMQDRPHARTARAQEDVQALAFSAEDWLDVLEDHAELVRGAQLAHGEAVRRGIAELSPDGGFPGVDPLRSVTDLGDSTGLVERIVLLSEAPAFERAGIQALATLAKVAEQRRLEPGEVLLALGDRPRGIYLVGDGSVEMSRDEPKLAARFGPGTLAGGLSFLGLERADVELRAGSRATVVSVAEDDFFDVQEDHFDLARAVFAYMSLERSAILRERARRSGGGER